MKTEHDITRIHESTGIKFDQWNEKRIKKGTYMAPLRNTTCDMNGIRRIIFEGDSLGSVTQIANNPTKKFLRETD